jgi:hypothetical protein
MENGGRGGRGGHGVRFLRRRRGVVDGYVGDVLVGTLFRTRSPSSSGSSWTAVPLGSDPVGDLTLAEARVVLRFSDRARSLWAALWPEPGRTDPAIAQGPSEGRPLRQGPLPARSGGWAEGESSSSGGVAP